MSTGMLCCRWICTGVLVHCMLSASFGQDKNEASAGTIRGKVAVPHTDDVTGDIMRGRALNRYNSNSLSVSKSIEPYRLSEKTVVYIETIQGSFTPPSANPQLNQRDMVFRPIVLPVVVGTTVDFPNSDDLFHNVFSLSQPKEFDLGRYSKGQKKSVKFDKPGVVSVFCEIHSYMFATILVLQNPYFAVPDDEGNYSIANVPPGTYRLSFWYGRKKVETATVTVTAGQAATKNFAY